MKSMLIRVNMGALGWDRDHLLRPGVLSAPGLATNGEG
jgi:hypothetical protein